jgi:hypothetical protein
LDFCVLDTCLNAAKNRCGEVFMIMDAARAAHIPDVGPVGTGFLQDPLKIKELMQAASVKLVPTAALVPGLLSQSAPTADPWRHAMLGTAFPETLGPWALVTCGDIECSVDVQKATWSAVEPKSSSEVLKQFLHKPSGRTSALSKVTLWGNARAGLGISQSATSFLWAYPVTVDGMTDQQRGYFALTTPEAAFFMLGGFVYLDSAGKVSDIRARAVGKGLNFEAPRKCTDLAFTREVNWQPVSAPLLKAKGAKTYTWITSEDVDPSNGCEHGAFVFRFAEGSAVWTDRDVYFAVSPFASDERDESEPLLLE